MAVATLVMSSTVAASTSFGSSVAGPSTGGAAAAATPPAATPTQRSFCTGDPVEPARHFAMDRSATVASLSGRLLGGEVILLYAHRMAGKTTVIKRVMEQLSVSGVTAVELRMDATSMSDEAAIWRYMSGRLTEGAAADGISLAPFTDKTGFHAAMRSDVWDGRRVILLFDEFDQLLEASEATRVSILSELRGAWQSTGTALRGLLGVGVPHIVRLRLPDSSCLRVPFDCAAVETLEHPPREALTAMMREFATEYGVGSDLAEYIADDIYSRTAGHPGLTSFLAASAQRWIVAGGPAEASADGWLVRATNLCRYNLAWESAAAAGVATATAHVCREKERAAYWLRVMLCSSGRIAPTSAVADIAAVDALESAGAIVRRSDRAGGAFISVAAPVLRTVLGAQWSSAAPPVPSSVRLARDATNAARLDLVKTLSVALQYVDRSTVFHVTSLLATGVPSEYAYHFALADAMRRIVFNTGWGLTCEVRDTSASSTDRRSRLDICIHTNGRRYGFEVIAHGKDLGRHFEAASRHARVMALTGALLVNFCVDERGALPFPPTGDEMVDLVHVVMSEAGDAKVVARDGRRLSVPVLSGGTADGVASAGAGAGTGAAAVAAPRGRARTTTRHFGVNGVVVSVGADATIADFLATAARRLDGASPDQLEMRTAGRSALVPPESPIATAADLAATVGILIVPKPAATVAGVASPSKGWPVTLLV